MNWWVFLLGFAAGSFVTLLAVFWILYGLIQEADRIHWW